MDGVQSGPNPTLDREDVTEHLSSLETVPLFMKQLPGDEKDRSTDALDALQSLTFDGTPDEVATSFKKQGNDYYVAKRFTEARGFYTQALDAYPTDPKLKETLLVNRAACNLALQNHGLVLKDSSSALGLNSGSVKAFFRSAKALLALERFIEATDCCDHALLLQSSNADVKKLRSDIQRRRGEVERREAQRAERERRERETKVAMGKAFLARGLWVETTPKPPDNPHPAHFDIDSIRGTVSDPARSLLGEADKIDVSWLPPDPIRTPVVFPVVFLYPQHQQSDFVSHFHEDVTLHGQLDDMFPAMGTGNLLPWDVERQYFQSNLSILAITHAKRLLRMGKKLTLREAIDHCAREADKASGIERDGLVLQDGLLSFIVLPKGATEQAWISTFKQDRDRPAS